MDTHTDGLNYVPLLAQSTPKSTGIRLNSARRSDYTQPQRNSVVCYNGNYEGDLSMFGQRPLSKLNRHHRRLELIETDSDTEYKRELRTYQPITVTVTTIEQSHLRRLCTHYCDRVLTPERRRRLICCAERIYRSSCCRRLRALGSWISVWLVCLLRLLLYSLVRLSNYCNACWRGCVLLRNTARRLLWWMTLAKCGDAKHFAMLLLGTPLLFVVAILGFVLSIYCALREWLGRSGYFIRQRLM